MINIYLFLRKKIGPNAAKIVLLESHRKFCLNGAARTNNIYFFKQQNTGNKKYLFKAIKYKSFDVIHLLAEYTTSLHMRKAIEMKNVKIALILSFYTPIFTKDNIILIAKLDLVDFAKLDVFKCYYLKYDSVNIYKHFRGNTIPKDYVLITRYCPVKILDSLFLDLNDFCYLYKIAILNENENFIYYCFEKYDFFISEDFLIMAARFPRIISDFVETPNGRLCRQLVYNNDVDNIKKFLPQIKNKQELYEIAYKKGYSRIAKILVSD